jgi:hypothetical protein
LCPTELSCGRGVRRACSHGRCIEDHCRESSSRSREAPPAGNDGDSDGGSEGRAWSAAEALRSVAGAIDLRGGSMN